MRARMTMCVACMAVPISAEIQPAPSEITLSDGQVHTPDNGALYARYSPALRAS